MRNKNLFFRSCFIVLLVITMKSFSQSDWELAYTSGLAEPDTRGGVYVDDTWVWIGDHKDGLWRAKKCDGSEAGSTTEGDAELWDVYHAGNYIYGASGDKKLYIYDDVNGQLVGSASTTDVVWGVYVTGNYAYLAGNKGLEVFDVSDPSNPVYLTSLDSANGYVAIEGAGNYIYANQYADNIMLVYDISSTPASPVHVGTYDPGMSGEIRRSFVDGPNNLVYIVNDAADLYIVDVSNPNSPALEGSIFLDGGDSNMPAGGVYVRDNYALVATANGNDKGYLYWIDVSDPTNPAPIDTLYDNDFGFNEPYIDGCFVLVAAHDGYKIYTMTGFQPDALISNTDETNFIGIDVYNSNGLNQTKSQQINYGDSAVYKIKFKNDSSLEQQLIIEGQSSPSGWSYIYLDENNSDITTAVQNGSFATTPLATGESTILTLIKIPDETVSGGSTVTDTLTVSASGCDTGLCTPFEIDVVVAQTTLQHGPSSIGDYVWIDTDGDGNQDGLEIGLSNVIIHLLTSTGDTVTTDTTDSNGLYSFSPLAAGNYYIHVKNGSLPPYYWTTTNNDPMLVNLDWDEDYTTADFGYNQLQSPDYDPTGYLYDEETGEIISGGLVAVNGPGQITTTKDGSSGEYAFYADGTPGTYTLTLTVPPGYVLSTVCLPQDPPAYDPTGQSNPVVLGNSENGTTGFLTSNDCTPFYYTFILQDGDPFIINNNFPLKKVVYDFGDSPDPSYPTLLANNGARHAITEGVYLGSTIDDELDGLTGPNAQGDDNDNLDDDDGINFVNDILAGGLAFVNVTASAPGYLNAWVDFNRDGDWSDSTEQVFEDQPLIAGANSLNIQFPPDTVSSTTIARFRYNTAGNLSFDGLATDGEVEDYKIYILADRDTDGVPDTCETCSEDRDGDGIKNCEDYDPSGYIFNEITGEIIAGGSISVAGPGNVSIIHDGSDGYYEFYTDGTTGTYTITLTVPPGYQVSETCLPQDPPAFDPTGMVNPVVLGHDEDGHTGYLTSTDCTPFYYSFELEPGDPFIFSNNFPLKHPLTDYGDAPDPSYPTLNASNGAYHYIIDGYFLGTTIDSESDGQPTANSLGDDSDGIDDDDGVIFSSPLMQFFENSIDIVATGNGYINAWMDFNGDGDWDDSGENIIVDEAVTAGTNTINFQVPLIDATGNFRTTGVSSRFRFSSQQGLGYAGVAPDGEVEDYAIDILISVELSSFQAISSEGTVQISWSTSSETENMGFHIYRSEQEDGHYEKITDELIPGAGNSESEKSYHWVDNTAEPGKFYYYQLADYSLTGSSRKHKPVLVSVELPKSYSLKQNYPNPFNPETTIGFSLKEAGQVELTVYNMQGQLVRTIVNKHTLAGSHVVKWDGRNDQGLQMPSGAYVYKIRVNEFEQSRKMMFTK